MKQLSCDQCRERWDELIDKSTYTAAPQFADVRAHLESCADCRKTFEMLIAARQELQQLPSPKAPASLRANILRQIDTPQKQAAPWWQSIFVSPQRLAWASGAIVTVLVVALLMRPEHQTQVFETAPNGLSNRAQVAEHNNTVSQPATQQPKPASEAPAKKVIPQKAPRKEIVKKPTIKPQRRDRQTSMPPRAANPPQDAVSPAPTIKNKLPLPRIDQSSQNIPQQKSDAAPPSPINTNSEPNDQPANNAGKIAKSVTRDSTIQPKSTNRSMMRGAQGSVAANSALESQNTGPIIHWSKTITSDYDVANAEITLTLGSGLAFAGDAHNQSKRILWRGTLFRTKQIPLNINLQRTSNGAAKLHLLMIDATTQKVLMDKIFEIN